VKINIQDIDNTQFMVHENIVNGELMYLVQPCPNQPRWTQKTKIFRSSLWSADGELVSAGFPKFCNWGEAPEEFPVPTDLKDATVVEKLDGSLLIVSKWKGKFIIRTRGTTDASNLTTNGFELVELMERFPAIKQYQPYFETWPFSLLFEWTSPLQKIVLNYGDKSNIKLVGCVNHTVSEIHGDYWLTQQDWLDGLAKGLGVERPLTYTFTTVADLMEQVDAWQGLEGVCVYTNGGQTIHKVKSSDYLIKHRFKSQATFENTLELFFGLNKPSYSEFENLLIEKFDYECFNMVRGYASTICDGYKEVLKIIDSMTDFVKVELSKYPTRKLQAVVTFQSYGKNSNRSSFIFKILDGKSLNDDDLKKLLWQVTKK
jgi:hypothetical protein